MEIELKRAGLIVKSQEPIEVFYEGETVGEFVADLVVEDTVIVELKSAGRVVCWTARRTPSRRPAGDSSRFRQGRYFGP